MDPLAPTDSCVVIKTGDEFDTKDIPSLTNSLEGMDDIPIDFNVDNGFNNKFELNFAHVSRLQQKRDFTRLEAFW